MFSAMGHEPGRCRGGEKGRGARRGASPPLLWAALAGSFMLVGCSRRDPAPAAPASPAVSTPVAAATASGPGAPGGAPGNAAPESDSGTPRSFASFRPSQHGFAFNNRYYGSPLPVVLGNEKRLGIPERYGLCGGM